MRLRVGSLASLSGLRIRRHRELWCRSQTRLGSGVAVAVVSAVSCSSGSAPSLGTSLCCRWDPKKSKKKETFLVNPLPGWFALSGRVSWDEYRVKFLASKGHDEREIADKIKNKWDLNIDEESECLASCGRCDVHDNVPSLVRDNVPSLPWVHYAEALGPSTLGGVGRGTAGGLEHP